MRRLILLAVLAIAVLFGGSVALIAMITGDRPAEPARASPVPELPAAAPAPVVIAPVPAPAPFVLPAPATPPVVSPEPEPPPPPPVVREGVRPELDLGRSVPALQQRITGRCGRMQVRSASSMPGEDAPETVLLLELAPEGQQLAIVNSWVRSPGETRPALVACAQWALRGVKLDAPATRGDASYKVPVILSVEPPPEARGE
jgi:hypothetical protein